MEYQAIAAQAKTQVKIFSVELGPRQPQLPALALEAAPAPPRLAPVVPLPLPLALERTLVESDVHFDLVPV